MRICCCFYYCFFVFTVLFLIFTDCIHLPNEVVFPCNLQVGSCFSYFCLIYGLCPFGVIPPHSKLPPREQLAGVDSRSF